MPVTYTKDALKSYSVGHYSYGVPKIIGKQGKVIIGKFCSFADGIVILQGVDHRVDWLTTYPFPELWAAGSKIKGHPNTKGDVVIGNDVWIGYGVTIMSGISIGDGAVVAARSVVTKDVVPYGIVAGNPARFKKLRFPQPVVDKLLKVKWWDWAGKNISKNLSHLCSGDTEWIMKL